MKNKTVLKKLLPHNFLWGSMTKKMFFTASTVVVFLAFFLYSHYDGLTGDIDVTKAKTDALEERLEQQICAFDGVHAAEVTIHADGSVLVQLETQPEFMCEEQIKEYVQAFVSCRPVDISLSY